MLGSVGSGRRTTTSSTLCQRFRSRSAWVRRQHSPLLLLCIIMILRVRRNFFEITTFPNNRDTQDVICEEKPCKSVDMMTVTATLALA